MIGIIIELYGEYEATHHSVEISDFENTKT